MDEIPDEELISDPARIAAGFSQLLRGLGLEVPLSRVMSFVQALGRLGLSERHSVYWAGRATLISDPEDIELYNRAFEVFWERKRPSGLDVELPAISVSIATDSDEEAAKLNLRLLMITGRPFNSDTVPLKRLGTKTSPNAMSKN